LESELVAGMRTAIDNVEGRSGEDEGWLDSSKICQVLVEGNTLLGGSSLRYSDGNAKDSIGSKFSFVGGTVELDEEVIDFLLVENGESRLDKFRRNNVVDVGDSFRNTYDA